MGLIGFLAVIATILGLIWAAKTRVSPPDAVYPIHSHSHRLDPARVTSANQLDGVVVVKTVGIVRGITVRSRSIVGNWLGGLQTVVGGNLTIYTQLCERARDEAFDLMAREAQSKGANAIVAFRYDATELMGGVTEVIAYGTALVVHDASAPPV